MCDYTTMSGCVSNGLAGGQGFGWKMIGNFVTQKFGEDVWMDPSEQVKIVNMFVSHMNAHQRVILAEDFNNQVGRMTHSVDTIQPLSPAMPVIT